MPDLPLMPDLHGKKDEVERRREERKAASEPLKLTLQDPEVIEIPALLVDVSASGFRASHHHTGLRSGQEVQVQTAHGFAQARVMWNLILEDLVQSGFLIRGGVWPFKK